MRAHFHGQKACAFRLIAPKKRQITAQVRRQCDRILARFRTELCGVDQVRGVPANNHLVVAAITHRGNGRHCCSCNAVQAVSSFSISQKLLLSFLVFVGTPVCVPKKYFVVGSDVKLQTGRVIKTLMMTPQKYAPTGGRVGGK